MTILYNVQKGSCTQSFGVFVAMAAGFPSDVISSAKRKAAELESESSFWGTEEGKRRHAKIVSTVNKFLALPIPQFSSAPDLKVAVSTLDLRPFDV